MIMMYDVCIAFDRSIFDESDYFDDSVDLEEPNGLSVADTLRQTG